MMEGMEISSPLYRTRIPKITGTEIKIRIERIAWQVADQNNSIMGREFQQTHRGHNENDIFFLKPRRNQT